MNNFQPDVAKILEVKQTSKQETPPLPYSLSSLQIEAGKRYNFSPKVVLDSMQKLYEMKLTTYPRSDCDYLPENQFDDAPQILQNLNELTETNLSELIKNVDTQIKSRAWNDKKISAHHAIIPTQVKPDWSKLDETQQKLYIMVAQRFIAQFYKNFSFVAIQFKIKFENQIFIVKGKNIVDEGWKIIFKKTESDEEQSLPNLSEGDTIKFLQADVSEKVTKPPAHFSPSTLLQAMKEIYKFVKDDSLKNKLKDCSGIGTEATRAGIIDKLQKNGFLKTDKKFLIPTPKALDTFRFLPDELIYPDLTIERFIPPLIEVGDFSLDVKSGTSFDEIIPPKEALKILFFCFFLLFRIKNTRQNSTIFNFFKLLLNFLAFLTI